MNPLSRILISAAALTATLTSGAAVGITPGDRIDAFFNATTFQSILVDDVKSITYQGSDQTGYTHIILETADQTLTIPISQLYALEYRPVDYSVPFEIKVVNHEHAAFRMLYNHNDPTSSDPIDPTKPFGWRGAMAGDPVFYNLAPEKGYTCDYTITGQYSGKEYHNVRRFVSTADPDFTAKFGLGVECLMYNMPFEPVTMTIAATELTDYEGLEILGTYRGGRLSTLGSNPRKSSSDEATYTLKANTTFTLTTTDSDGAIDLTDCFTYDEGRSAVTHVPDPDDVNKNPMDLNVKWGVDAKFFTDGLTVITAHYLPDNTSSNARRYFATTYPSTFAIGASQDDYRMILEITENGTQTPRYYLFEDYANTHSAIDMEFAEGTSIALPCVAYAVRDGQRIIKYTLTDTQSAPEFKLKGTEAGTYTYTGSNSHSDLKLDGFGTATVDGSEYTYTISSGEVTIALPSGDLIVIIDINAHTYAEKNQDSWEGAKIFSSTHIQGSYAWGDISDQCTMTLRIDQNVNGTSNPGYAAISVDVPRPAPDSPLTIMAAGGVYEYNSSAHTLTVTNVGCYIWSDADGRFSYQKRNFTFSISADLKSMTLLADGLGEYIGAYAQDGSYFLSGETCVIYADGKEPSGEPEVNIDGTYTGTASVDLNGYSASAAVTLIINDGKAQLISNTMGMDLLNSTVDYTFADNTLVLKGVTVGNGDKFSGLTVEEDITFTYTDGAFTGSGRYYGNTSTTAAIATILDGVVFSK